MTTIVTVSIEDPKHKAVEIRGIHLDEDGHEVYRDTAPTIVNPGESKNFTVFDTRRLEISEIK